MSTTAEGRSVARVIESTKVMEGAGMPVRRSVPTAAIEMIDPFLLLDHLGPTRFAPGGAPGFPDHPHRGFETVSYILEGELEHRDSNGEHGVLGPGDVQWMTAGSGVVHSEMPSEAFTRKGGVLHGFQIWVNLPRVDKMMRLRYQHIQAANIPQASSSDGLVHARVIAGDALGTSAIIETRLPITFVHYTLKPGADTEHALPEGHTAFAYVIQGAASFGPTETFGREGQLVLFGASGGSIRMRVPSDASLGASLLLIAAKPLREPVARYGPFVMCTPEEIHQAIRDYQAGKMGVIARA